MFVPIKDENSNSSGFALMTWVLIAANIVVFGYFQKFGANFDFTVGYASISYELSTGTDLVGFHEGVSHAAGPRPLFLTMLTHMFMHVGWGHLIGNLVFLLVFGHNLETRFGHVTFVIFYLLAGVLSELAHVGLRPYDMIPGLGASGAISGMMGTYLVLFPHNSMKVLLLFRVVSVPAWMLLFVWIALQVVSGLLSMGARGGVAYDVHIAGFLAGAILGLFYRLTTQTVDKFDWEDRNQK